MQQLLLAILLSFAWRAFSVMRRGEGSLFSAFNQLLIVFAGLMAFVVLFSPLLGGPEIW